MNGYYTLDFRAAIKTCFNLELIFSQLQNEAD